MKFFLLAILLAMVASARAAAPIYPVTATGPTTGGLTGQSGPPPTGVVADVQASEYCPEGGIKPGATITVTWINANFFYGTPVPTPIYSYGIKCERDGPGGADCFAPAPAAYYAPPNYFLAYQYVLPGPGVYFLTLYGNGGAAFDITGASKLAEKYVSTQVCGGCPGGPGNCNDPIITGFDGSTFHFDDVGEYVMLESGDGYKVHTTFAGATAANSDLEVMERSWTSSVRMFSPNGDMVSCALPAIVPNTSRLQVTAVSASEATMLSIDKQEMELPEMSVTVLLSEGDGPKSVTGCILSTPKLDIRVDQVSGYEQAIKFPDTEAWAAPFTWLNSGFTVKKPLASPVTGILGATYPADKVAEQYALAAGSEGTKTSARMDGEGPGPKTHRRALAAQPTPFLPVSSGIVGLSH